jgi:hypothetical protein
LAALPLLVLTIEPVAVELAEMVAFAVLVAVDIACSTRPPMSMTPGPGIL